MEEVEREEVVRREREGGAGGRGGIERKNEGSRRTERRGEMEGEDVWREGGSPKWEAEGSRT